MYVGTDTAARLAAYAARTELVDRGRREAAEIDIARVQNDAERLIDAVTREKDATCDDLRRDLEDALRVSAESGTELKRASIRAERAEDRTRQLEHLAKQLDDTRATLSDQVRKARESADARVRAAVESMSTQLTTERDRTNQEKDKTARLESDNRDLQDRIDDLQNALDLLRKVPRGPHFGKFVELKEQNEELHERLQDALKRLPSDKVLPVKPTLAALGSSGTGGARASSFSDARTIPLPLEEPSNNPSDTPAGWTDQQPFLSRRRLSHSSIHSAIDAL